VTSELRDRLLALAAFADAFARPGFTFGAWADPAPDEDGTIQMPWFDYNADADAFRAAAAGNGWVRPFDWMAWAASNEGRRLIDDPRLVADASVDDLTKLLTACIRGDRFVEGNLAGALESGMLLAIVRRAAVLAETIREERR